MRARGPLVALLLAACSSADERTVDARPDLATHSDSSGSETTPSDQQVGDGLVDSDAQVDDGVVDQQQPDMATLDTGGRPVGQCFGDEHCFFDAPCVIAAPGGVCSGCTMPSDCGDTFVFDCGDDGSCKRLCTTDKHCPLGHVCSSAKLCEVQQCSGSMPCPSPYICQDGRCARPPCATGCPSTMFCGEGDFCLENYP